MTPAALAAFGRESALVAVVVLWVVALLRVPGACWSPPQRRLLLAVTGLALSVTVYVAPVAEMLSRTPLAAGCGIAMNVWGVLSSAFILDFVLAALSSRRPVMVYGGAAGASAALVALNAADGGRQAGCVTTADVEWYSPFWWLLCLAHVVAVLPSMVVCARAARRARARSAQVGLGLLAAGFASSTLFWGVVVPIQLVTDSVWVGASFPLDVALTTTLVAVGTAVPLVAGAASWLQHAMLLGRLRPLWRLLVDAVPEVRLPEAAAGRRGRWTTGLRLYRCVIEIRDALLVLRGHVDAACVRAATAHAVAAGGDTPLATACWMTAALDARARGLPAADTPAELPTPCPTGDVWLDEIAFQTALAAQRRSPAVACFVAVRAVGERPHDRISR